MADPGLTVGGGAKYTARVSAREILCATPTFGPFTNDVRPARSTHQKARFARDNNNYY